MQPQDSKTRSEELARRAWDRAWCVPRELGHRHLLGVGWFTFRASRAVVHTGASRGRGDPPEERPRPRTRTETGGGGEEGQEDPGRQQPCQPPTRGPASEPAHLRPGRQEPGPQRQVSQKFLGLRRHGGRHLNQESLHGGGGQRVRSGKGGRGGGGPGRAALGPAPARAGCWCLCRVLGGRDAAAPVGERLAAVPEPVPGPRALPKSPSPGSPSSLLAFRGLWPSPCATRGYCWF